MRPLYSFLHIQIQVLEYHFHTLDKDELVDIMDGSKKFKWHIHFGSRSLPRAFALLDEACSYYKQLYETDKKREFQCKGKKYKHAEDNNNQP